MTNTKPTLTAEEKLAKARERKRVKHLNALCVCGTPFGMHTREQTHICAMQRS